MLKEDNDFWKYVNENDRLFVKESKFSYIRPIDGKTRLMLYNYSNMIGVEGITIRGSKVIVEVSDGYLIIFISDIFHTGLES